ncbi:MAG: AraC family transcriptional regulator [Methyloligellaceae bacterium]
MDKNQQKELITFLAEYSRYEGKNETPITAASIYKSSVPDTRMPIVYNPSLCVIIQGKKRVMLEEEVYDYDASKYLVASVNLPVVGQVLKASRAKPYLCLKIDIDLLQLSDLIISMDNLKDNQSTTRGIFIGSLNHQISDCILRLLHLFDKPDDIPFLAPMVLREIYYHLLRGEHAHAISQIAIRGSNMQRIALVIEKIQSSFINPLSIDELAELAGMSTSSLHAHFKAVTAITPIQFQKRLRLTEARNIMLSESVDAASAAYKVGYESPSQFSREYARMFGNPPARDIEKLKSSGYRQIEI